MLVVNWFINLQGVFLLFFNRIKLIFWLSILLIGVLLTSINFYGLSKDIRPLVFLNDELRFKNDITQNLETTLNNINPLNNESELEFSSRITEEVSNGLAHIHWDRYDSEKFNQLIPIWENYFLYFMGKFSGIPEFERYHYADYQRSLNRGIGICGDASMIMSQLLTKNGIENQIITFPGHVIVTVKFKNEQDEMLFDPDFGVVLPFTPDEIKQAPSLVNEYYLDAGYFNYDVTTLNKIYSNKYKRWNGVKHFITKKYYFEYITYALKWPLPFLMILLSTYYLFRKKLIETLLDK